MPASFFFASSGMTRYAPFGGTDTLELGLALLFYWATSFCSASTFSPATLCGTWLGETWIAFPAPRSTARVMAHGRRQAGLMNGTSSLPGSASSQLDLPTSMSAWLQVDSSRTSGSCDRHQIR